MVEKAYKWLSLYEQSECRDVVNRGRLIWASLCLEHGLESYASEATFYRGAAFVIGFFMHVQLGTISVGSSGLPQRNIHDHTRL